MNDPIRTIEATVRYQNNRYFAVIPQGQWQIEEEAVRQFAVADGETIVIEEPNPQDQFCKFQYVVPQADIFNRQFEEWKGDSDGSVGQD